MELEQAVKNIELILDNNVQGLNGIQFKAIYQSWETIKKELNKNDRENRSDSN